MLEVCGDVAGSQVLDVGCGEGRFCRMLAARRASVVGIDPTTALIEAARRSGQGGSYVEGVAEQLPFEDCSFDLVVSYLTLIDVSDANKSIAEMARVVRSAGRIVIANLNSFTTAASGGWRKDAQGRSLFLPLDRYFDERPEWTEWADMRIVNWHRPFETYMKALLAQGLRLRRFIEPRPSWEAIEECPTLERGSRVPWFHVMEWSKD
jgi:ubiquinone/menaquinone biosynthesis C-methylase UbiE